MKKLTPKNRIHPGRPAADRQPDTPAGRNADTAQLILEASRAWDSLAEFRRTARRCRDYTYGKQWNDTVEDPATGRPLTEEAYIKAQGKIPLKNNMIRQLVKSVLGQFASNQTEPVCVAGDRNEQKLGEMMTIIMRYAYTINKLWDLDRRTLEQYLIAALCCHKIQYGWNAALGKEDAFVTVVNHNRLFFDNNMSDYRYWDCNLIGEIHDLTLSDLIATFARGDRNKAVELRRIYAGVTDEALRSAYRNLTAAPLDNLTFLQSGDHTRCRVIEIWRRESRERIKCHDILQGEYYKIEADQYPHIEKINRQRIQEGRRQGLAPDDIPLIETQWFIDRCWHARWLTPFGDILHEMETPYWHKSHPYVLSLYPFIDGEVHSFVEDILDQQRYVNRLITMVDFIMGASAKGVLLFPEDQIPDGMTIEDIADEWTRYNGVILFRPRPGGTLPQQISTNATNVGAYEMLNLQMRLLEQISGVHGALQGKQPHSGTAASLYAQEAQNSATNLVDLLAAFNTFREDRDTKLMQTIQQYYHEKRYINISGSDYSEEAKWFDPERVRNVHFDLTITESTATPAYRQQMNDFLMQLFQLGQIQIEDVLENGAFPFADRLLQAIQKRKEEMQQAAQQQAQLLAQMQTAPTGQTGQSPEQPAGQTAPIAPELQPQIDSHTHPLMLQALQQ
ncbi:MAG: hypothetical protein J1E02_05870 [Coprobacter sp.]|nr:hypothetical protein [Coprobacter sp.]